MDQPEKCENDDEQSSISSSSPSRNDTDNDSSSNNDNNNSNNNNSSQSSNNNSNNPNNNNNNNNNAVYDENHGRISPQIIPLHGRGVMSQDIRAQYESVTKLRELLSTQDSAQLIQLLRELFDRLNNDREDNNISVNQGGYRFNPNRINRTAPSNVGLFHDSNVNDQIQRISRVKLLQNFISVMGHNNSEIGRAFSRIIANKYNSLHPGRHEIGWKIPNITMDPNYNNNSDNNTRSPQLIPVYASGLISGQISQQYQSAKGLRELLSDSDSPPTKEVIDIGVIPRLIQLSRDHKHPRLQYECLHALVDITGGPAEGCAQVIKNGGHYSFIDLLKSSKLYEIKERAMWTLANLAAYCRESKDLLLNNRILSSILRVSHLQFDENCVTNYNESEDVENLPIISFLRLLSITSWTIRNLCGISPPPKLEQLELIIQCMQFVIKQGIFYTQHKQKLFEFGGHFDDEIIEDELDAIISNIAWGASNLFHYDYANVVYDGLKYSFEKMTRFGLIGHFVSFMDYNYSEVRHACCRVIGNIVANFGDVRKLCSDSGILEKYRNILIKYNNNNENDEEIAEIPRAIANIVYGDDTIECTLLVEKHGLFKILCQLLKNSSFDVAKQALRALTNASIGARTRIVNKLVNHYGLIELLCAFLPRIPGNNTRILGIALDCIQIILMTEQQYESQSDESNKYAARFQMNGLHTIIMDMDFDETEEKRILWIESKITDPTDLNK